MTCSTTEPSRRYGGQAINLLGLYPPLAELSQAGNYALLLSLPNVLGEGLEPPQPFRACGLQPHAIAATRTQPGAEGGI